MTPDGPPDPLATALAVIAALDRIGATYVIGGSFASSLYGEPRSTNDIDIVIDLTVDRARALTDALGARFYVRADAAERAAGSGGTFNVIDTSTAVKVDVFVAGANPLDQERLRMRRTISVSGASGPVEVFVDTAENTVVRKLEWFRRGGGTSSRQWQDIVGVLRAQRGRLNAEYLRAWAERLELTDLLQRAKADAET